MFQHSHNNHYKWGWGSTEWFAHRSPEHSIWRVTFGQPQREVKSFREECIAAAKLILDCATKEPVVALSGGSDSQVVTLSLLANKVKPRIAIARLNDEINIHDVRAAVEFCNRNDLKYEITDIDIRKFYTEWLPVWSQRYGLGNTRVPLQLFLQQKYDDFLFLSGGGDLQLSRYGRADVSGLTTLAWRLAPTPIFQHLVETGVEGCTKFFMYTPELIAAQVQHPVVRSFANAQRSIFSAEFLPVSDWHKVYNYAIKPQFYLSEWPELLSRPKKTGFEKADADAEIEALAAQAVAAAKELNDGHRVVMSYSDLQEYCQFGSVGSPRVWVSRQSAKHREQKGQP